MDSIKQIRPPFFELGPKAYLFGKDFIDLVVFADKLAKKYRVSIIVTPQYVDIPEAAKKTRNVFVFAQHMDPIPVGRGIGAVLPEAIKAAGACGVLLNHVEKRLGYEELKNTVSRAKEVGLMTMVCADDMVNAVQIAEMKPTIIVVESPDLIGQGKRNENEVAIIKEINDAIKSVSEKTLVLHGAGISTPDDVYEVIAAGAQGSGSTSGVMLAKDRFQMLEEMIRAVHKAWKNQAIIKEKEYHDSIQ